MAGGEDVADLYAVLFGELQLLGARLPQAIGQLASHVQQPGTAVRFGVDYGGDATALTEDATATLTVAADLASGPVQRLADAHSVVSHLYAPHRVSGVDREAEAYPI
jgi:hypothetical protein